MADSDSTTMELPPGATLVSDDSDSSSGLPPGAKLVSGSLPDKHPPETQAAASPTPPPQTMGQKVVSGAENLGIGAAKGIGHTLTGLSPLINKIPYVGETLAPSEGIRAWDALTKPAGTAQKIGFGGEQAAEFLIPSGLEEKAGVLAAEHLPQAARIAGPAARIATSALTSGAVNKLQGGSFKTGAETGAAFSGLGEGAKAMAPGLAETALGVTRRMRGFGKTPGEAALNEIKGIRPETLGENAQAAATRLTGEVEKLAKGSTAQVSTKPALNLIDQEMQTAEQQNAEEYYDALAKMRNKLTTRFKTGAQISQNLSPSELLDLKRGIGKLDKTWNPETKTLMSGMVRKVYGALDGEIDRAVPETQGLNQRISSLIPVAQRAENVSRGAGLPQRVAGRMAAHTGALAGAIGGGALGYKQGGVPQAVAGATAGLAIPEILASPSVQMAIARALNSPLPARLARGVALNLPAKEKPDTEDEDH